MDQEIKEKPIYTILKEICEEKGIEFKYFSYGWIIQMSLGDIKRYVSDSRFDLNNVIAGQIVCDKFATFELLEDQRIPVIKHHMIFNPRTRKKYVPDEGTFAPLYEYLRQYGRVVIKPNDGSLGKGIYRCETNKEIEYAVLELFKGNGSISLCPFYDIAKEYRTFYLDGECLHSYAKTKPQITGDGQRTIRELVSGCKQELIDGLLNKNIDLETVLPPATNLELSWKHNLSRGAIVEEITDYDKLSKIHDIVKMAGAATGITFATVDVAELSTGELLVMEVNLGIGMSKYIEQSPIGYEQIKRVLSCAVDKMFSLENIYSSHI